jgi:UPF0716 protein FxsA
MLLKLFLAFTLLPIAELYLLIEVGGRIGAAKTILLVIATGLAGAWLARVQGLQTMYRVKAALRQGRRPTDELLDALLIFAAGVVLLAPGFITDAAGLLLLIPETRRLFKGWLQKRLEHWLDARSAPSDSFP